MYNETFNDGYVTRIIANRILSLCSLTFHFVHARLSSNLTPCHARQIPKDLEIFETPPKYPTKA